MARAPKQDSSTSTELTLAEGNALPAEIAALLPDLVKTQTLALEGRDVTFPRLKISHPSQTFVQDGVVPPFGIYSELNREDDAKVVLFDLAGKEKPDPATLPDAGILAYVLAMKKGLSANIIESTGEVVPKNTEGATFKSWGYDDPTAPRGKGVDVTYNFVLYVPEVDRANQPHRLLMTRSSTSTARTILTYLTQLEEQGLPLYAMPFRIWSVRRERQADGQTQRWGIFKAQPTTPTKDDVLAASKMTKLVNELDSTAHAGKLIDVDDEITDAVVVNSGFVTPAKDEPAI